VARRKCSHNAIVVAATGAVPACLPAELASKLSVLTSNSSDPYAVVPAIGLVSVERFSPLTVVEQA